MSDKTCEFVKKPDHTNVNSPKDIQAQHWDMMVDVKAKVPPLILSIFRENTPIVKQQFT